MFPRLTQGHLDANGTAARENGKELSAQSWVPYVRPGWVTMKTVLSGDGDSISLAACGKG